MSRKLYDSKDLAIIMGGFRIDAPINQKVSDFARSAVRGTSPADLQALERQGLLIIDDHAPLQKPTAEQQARALYLYEHTIVKRAKCSEPNIQNIPLRTILGRAVVNAFRKPYEPAQFSDLVGDLLSHRCMSWDMSWAEQCRLETIRAIKQAPPATEPKASNIFCYTQALAACLEAMASGA